ncbi:MAG: radical SAM protein [Ruminococcus flavefaciens]|nr:radical SAM protein [Ruminococcus flavefaciens]
MAYIDENNQYIQNARRPLIQDVDSIPFPAWDLFTMEHYVLYPRPNASRSDRCLQMISGRGCPFHCNFCYRMDSGFRPRSAESIVAEIKEIKSRFHVNYISFDDELLMSSVPRTKEIAQAIIDNKLDIKFWCNGRLNYACKDTEMLQMLKEAGCVFINYGIESMDDGALKRMRKNLTTDMVIAGIENTLKTGISPGLNIIFGNLDENMEILKKDVEFLLKYDDGAQLRTIRPVTPYPGTELYNIAIERGLIKDIGDFYENKHTNSDLLTCNFTNMSDEEFYQALDWANGTLLNAYLEKQREKNKYCLYELYQKHNAEFRGFRPV